MKNKRSFLANSISAYFPFVIDFFLKLIVIRLVLDYLGAELLGTWAVLKSVIAFPLFLQQGLSFAIFVETSRESYRSSRSAEALVLVLIFSSIVTTALMLLSGPFATFFAIPEQHIHVARTAFRLAAFTFFFTSVSSVFTQILQGVGRFDLAGALQSGISLLSSCASIVLLQRGYELIALIQVDLASAILSAVAGFLLCRLAVGQNPLSFSIESRGILVLIKEAAGQLSLSGLTKILWEVDLFLIPRFFGITPMASYWMAQRLTTGWRTFLWAGAWPAVPAIAEATPQTMDRMKKIHWLQVSLSVPIAACLWNFSDEIIRTWAGVEDPLASFALKALVIAGIFDFIPATFVSYLFAQRRVFTVAKIMLGAAMIKVLIAAVACYLGDIELLIASTAVGALFFLIVVHVVILKILRSLLKTSLLLLLCVLIASFNSILLSGLFQRPGSLVSLIWLGILSLAFSYGLILLILRLFFPDLFQSLRHSAASLIGRS